MGCPKGLRSMGSNHNLSGNSDSANRLTTNAKKPTKAEDRNPPITAYTLTSVRPSCFLRGQVCCTDYWQQNGVHVTVFWGLNCRTRPHSTLRKKKKKTKFWGRLLESVVFQKTVIESTFDYRIRAEYEYWIVHFMNVLLKQQTKSFFQ